MGKDFYKHKKLDQKGYSTEDWNKSPAEKSLGHIQGTEGSFVAAVVFSQQLLLVTWMRYQCDNTLYSKSALGGPRLPVVADQTQFHQGKIYADVQLKPGGRSPGTVCRPSLFAE